MEKEERIYNKTKKMSSTRKLRYLRHIALYLANQKKYDKKIIGEYLRMAIDKNDISGFMEVYLRLVEEAYRYDEEKKEVAEMVVVYMPQAIQYLYSQSDMELMYSEIFFKKMDMILEKYGVSNRRLYQEKFKYYISVGLWEKSFKSFSKWMNADMDKYSASLGEEEADRAYYYYLIGDKQTGDYIYENVANGVLRNPNLKMETMPRILRYQVEKGQLSEAVKKARNLYRMTQKKEKYLHLNAELMKIVFLYNEMMAYDIWRREYRSFQETQNEYDKFQFGVATFLLYRSFSQQGKTLKHMRKMKKVIDEMYEIQEGYDTKNRNSHFMEEILFWENVCTAIDQYNEQSN